MPGLQHIDGPKRKKREPLRCRPRPNCPLLRDCSAQAEEYPSSLLNKASPSHTGNPIKRESHVRSLLKGISWRIVATCDTVLVVALVTWLLDGKANIGDAVKIGVSEFILKFLVYYGHERVWEHFRTSDGLQKSRTLKKSISWRIIATTLTFILAGTILDDFGTTAIIITAVEFFSKFALYYIHERVWLRLPLGRVRGWVAARFR